MDTEMGNWFGMNSLRLHCRLIDDEGLRQWSILPSLRNILSHYPTFLKTRIRFVDTIKNKFVCRFSVRQAWAEYITLSLSLSFLFRFSSNWQGHRTDSRTSSLDLERAKETPRTSRILIDELETALREKVRSQMHDIRTKFRHASQNDPNGKINRQALQHFIATTFGTQRQISPNQIDKLLERLRLKHLNKIRLQEFECSKVSSCETYLLLLCFDILVLMNFFNRCLTGRKISLIGSIAKNHRR